MTTPWRVEWFTVPSGPREGQRHISGWSMTALAGCRVGICPVCFAYVPASDRLGELDLQWAHEQWHAKTDYADPGPAVTGRIEEA